MKKLSRKIHLWLSVPFGLLIAVICLTGAILVFEDEWMEFSRHDLYYVNKVEAQTLPVSELLQTVQNTLPDSVSVKGITMFANPQKAWQVSISKPMRASICVDQYTGEIKGRNERAPFFMFMFKMHRSLLGNMKPAAGEISVGKLVVGVSTLLMVVILISGLIVWIPRTCKAVKNRLQIKCNKGCRRFWYDLHVSGGIYTVVFLLALALTGLTWSFSWYRSAFYQVFGAEVKQQSSHGSGQKQQGKTASNKGHHGENGKGSSRQTGETTFTHWQTVYNLLSRQNPEYERVSITDGTASVYFSGFGNQRAADRYTFDPGSGAISETNLYADQDRAGKLRGWIYSVHVGSWGGLPTQILAFLAALLGAVLPLTGYYLWIKKMKRKRK